MTRLRTILNNYKDIAMTKPKHRMDINMDELYQAMRKSNDQQDMVNHPPHYTKGGIETIDIMEAKSTSEEFKGHLKLTALKYLTRAGHKESELQDAKKTQWYVNRWVKTLEKETVNYKVLDE
jgi:hypothetical protein